MPTALLPQLARLPALQVLLLCLLANLPAGAALDPGRAAQRLGLRAAQVQRALQALRRRGLALPARAAAWRLAPEAAELLRAAGLPLGEEGGGGGLNLNLKTVKQESLTLLPPPPEVVQALRRAGVSASKALALARDPSISVELVENLERRLLDEAGKRYTPGLLVYRLEAGERHLPGEQRSPAPAADPLSARRRLLGELICPRCCQHPCVCE